MAEETMIPERQWAWLLHGAGVENLGGPDLGPEEIAVARPGPGELLARVDACGICFSDLKIVRQGGSHARLYGRDLEAEPVIMGHEPAVTIVAVGEDLKDRFRVGERYVVQADIYVNGKSMAFGYMLPGAFEQYVILGEHVLNGDDGCYLLPITKESTSSSAAALSEPWACCVAAYNAVQRTRFAKGGVVWLRAFEGSNAALGDVIDEAGPPARIVTTDAPPALFERVLAVCTDLGIACSARDGADLDAVRSEFAPEGFSDIALIGPCASADAEAASAALARGGTLALVDPPKSLATLVDIGRVHYDALMHVGSTDGSIGSAYASRRGFKLRPEGSAWFVGAAGPMGQMHVQLAVERPNGPKLVVGTDVDDARLEHLRSRLQSKADANGVRLLLFNPMKDARGLAGALGEVAPNGFDDVVVMAPLARVVEEAWPFVGPDGVMNVFAGLPKGTTLTLNLAACAHGGARVIGTSGSAMSDLREVLEAAEAGELDTNMSVAAIGGIEAFREAIIATQEGRFPGKIVCYPNLSLPLTALTDLPGRLPAVGEKLGPIGQWTVESERELLTGANGNG